MMRMTRREFEHWLANQRYPIYVDPYEIVPCRCRDPNCHGWRLVRPQRVTDSHLPNARGDRP